MNSIKRIEWIDYAKGIAIFLVFWGHTSCPDYIRPIFYSFHIPLFFWLSGFVFSIKKYSSFKPFLWKKIRTLIIPGACFLLFASVLDSLIDVTSGIPVTFNPIKYFIGIFIEMCGSEYTGVPWFFFSLFVVEIVMYCILHTPVKTEKNLLIFGIACSILGYLYAIHISHILPWTVDVSVSALFFFILGYLSKLNQNQLLRLLKTPLIPVWGAAMLVLACANVYFDGGVYLDMYANQYGWYVFAFSAAMAGILFVSSVAYTLEKTSVFPKRVLNSLGKKHSYFMR